MMAPKSLQWRLSLWLGLGMALLWATAAALTAEYLRRQMDQVFDSALEETGQRVLLLAVGFGCGLYFIGNPMRFRLPVAQALNHPIKYSAAFSD